GGGGVDHPPALHLATAECECGLELPVDEEQVAFAPVYFIRVPGQGARVGQVQGAVRAEAVVPEDEQPLRQRGGQGIGGGANDEGAVEAPGHLVTGDLVRVRVIP